MANNIKIVGNITDTSTVNRYSEADIALITSRRLQEDFGAKEDYIEYYVYDAAENLLSTNYNYLSYKLPTGSALTPGITTTPDTTGEIQTTDVGVISTLTTASALYPIIEIDPIKDLQDLGYSSGEFIVKYNFFQNKVSDNTNRALFIKEISRDRTEIRLASVTLTNEEIETAALALIDKISNVDLYYVDYLLNFGNNEQYVAVNVALNKDPDGYEILFKLYKPLPASVQEKQTLWVVEEQSTSYNFNIDLDKLVLPAPPPTLKGPNFGIPLDNQGTVATSYKNYSNLILDLQSLQSSSYSRIQNLLTSQSIDINVDYTDFNNFVFFGSAKQRIINFYSKVKQIEDNNNFINQYTPFVATTASLQTTINQYSASIDNIVAQLDGYESYLYFESNSYAWPKSGSIKPFELLSTGSATVISWYNNLIDSADLYDLNNYDNLEFSVPIFVKDDETNQPYLTFLNMVGHYFDNIWIYVKAITDINLANNNLDYGISRDLVYQQLQSLGVKLYNSQAGDSVANYLLGANTGSSLWSNDFTITSSYLNNIPRKDLVAELYKRIYHNLPLLYKTKGTVAGLDNLMSIFGIPNKTYYTIGSETFYTPTGSDATASILNVKEFGGSLKANLINGYNNDKVRITSNPISGSVLSPFKSLQTYPTSSAEFRDDDLHYVDISFSPQSQIDTYISGAIASNNPTWSLDDYIGDPNHQYLNTYPDLDIQRTLYYQTGVPGFNPFTASLLDYNGFVRLIEFFDNSLFKMLNDFVPERTSLSTGVTINSPVLERNKVVYPIPSASARVGYKADYSASAVLSSQYGVFYNALSSSNNTEAWYDGDISGSIIDVNQYFEDNYNPYLDTVRFDINNVIDNDYITLTTSFVNNDGLGSFNYGGDIEFPFNFEKILGDITVIISISYTTGISSFNATTINVPLTLDTRTQYTLNYSQPEIPGFLNSTAIFVAGFSGSVYFLGASPDFPNSDWNVLLNNVSFNVPSNIRQRIEYIGDPIPTNSIYLPVELQDSYLSLISYNNSRYEGSKVTSLLYNTHTPSSSTYEGDKSYGKTAAIDHNVRKIGIFTRIESSQYLPRRNNVSLKYLIDETGNLTELNQLNKNWCEVQRSFIAGDYMNISLFDNKKFGNQKFTDGNKEIFDSGYNYYPTLYFSSSCPSTLAFTSLGAPNAFRAQLTNTTNPNWFISGSSFPPKFGLTTIDGTASVVGNLFNTIIEGSEYISAGTTTSFPSYSVQETGKHRIQATLPISFSGIFPPTHSSTWAFEIWKRPLSGPDVLLGSSSYNLRIPSEINISLGWSVDINSTPVGVYTARITTSGITLPFDLNIKFDVGMYSNNEFIDYTFLGSDRDQYIPINQERCKFRGTCFTFLDSNTMVSPNLTIASGQTSGTTLGNIVYSSLDGCEKLEGWKVKSNNGVKIKRGTDSSYTTIYNPGPIKFDDYTIRVNWSECNVVAY